MFFKKKKKKKKEKTKKRKRKIYSSLCTSDICQI